MTTYLHDLSNLTAQASTGRVDHIGDLINLALIERIEALVTEMAAMNLNLCELCELKTINTKLDALIQATKESNPL